jgi:hypothetical protein
MRASLILHSYQMKQAGSIGTNTKQRERSIRDQTDQVEGRLHRRLPARPAKNSAEARRQRGICHVMDRLVEGVRPWLTLDDNPPLVANPRCSRRIIIWSWWRSGHTAPLILASFRMESEICPAIASNARGAVSHPP